LKISTSTFKVFLPHFPSSLRSFFAATVAALFVVFSFYIACLVFHPFHLLALRSRPSGSPQQRAHVIGNFIYLCVNLFKKHSHCTHARHRVHALIADESSCVSKRLFGRMMDWAILCSFARPSILESGILHSYERPARSQNSDAGDRPPLMPPSSS
jgi:hypothetical protein